MNVLIFGLGSIGQRWARLLKLKYGEDVNIYAYRRRGLKELISSDLLSVQMENPSEKLSLIEVNSLKSLVNINFRLIIIASPISLHFLDLKSCLQFDCCNILVEKPLFDLSMNLDEAAELVTEFERRKINLLVGYQLRFHPITMKIKELLASSYIGLPFSFESRFLEWLPGMHPYEDYRRTHMSLESQGGGPLNCLSHDLDLVRNLFPNIKIEKIYNSKFGYLDTDVPDMVEVVWKETSTKGTTMAGRSTLDFVTWPPQHSIEIFGSGGTLKADFLSSHVEVISRAFGKIEFDFAKFTRDDNFLAELDFFLSIESKVLPRLDLARDTLTIMREIRAIS